MGLPNLKMNELEFKVPIVQGGMGVGVSGVSLAASVSAEGGLGVIASVGLGNREESRDTYDETSRNALLAAIAAVKGRGLRVGVNVMVALSNYRSLVEACAEGGADVIISGAGLPLRLPEYCPDRKVKLVPIVSSARVATLICRTWLKKHNRLPDAIIVEGPLAGGHLGFSYDELADGCAPTLQQLVADVVCVADDLESKHGKSIPVIAAGGIFTGEDIAEFLKLGAAGVQMGTRFVGTVECDASDAYKQSYVDAAKDDVMLIKSPVGLPARVLMNEFVADSLKGEKRKFSCTYRCLLTCDAKVANYCIADALVSSTDGDMTGGFAMCGANAYRVDKIVAVHDLMAELVREAEAALDG